MWFSAAGRDNLTTCFGQGTKSRRQVVRGQCRGHYGICLCEIAWAIGLKYTEGFSRVLPTIGTVVAMAASIGFLGLAIKSLPVGTAYAVWTGIGAVGTVALGIYLFNEPARLQSPGHHSTKSHLLDREGD